MSSENNAVSEQAEGDHTKEKQQVAAINDTPL
jgi:hypothetical protein